MNLNFNFYGCSTQPDLAAQINAIAAGITNLKDIIMATKAEFTASLDQVSQHVAKVGDETRVLIARINDLTAAVEQAGNSSPEMDAALEALKVQVAVVDDLVPDA